jgi:lipoate-protein ligase A
MRLFDYAFGCPLANVAMDEAILDLLQEATDRGEPGDEVLRLWQLPKVCVVLGRGSKLDEVHQAACEQDGVPVIRRCSGGASIVAGPGCLMYSLVLSLARRPGLREIDRAHRYVMERLQRATEALVPGVAIDGICDLTKDGRKCSGNAVRYKRDWVLYHGTLLCRFPLTLIERYLAMPPRVPAYRLERSHREFLVNLDVDPPRLKERLAQAWEAEERWESQAWLSQVKARTDQLIESKYR